MTTRPPTRLRIDARSESDIPLAWSRDAYKIVVAGKVIKNRTGFSAESIGMPIGGPGSETALVTQEMVDYEEPGDWTYLSLSSLHDEILVSTTRDDAECGQRWVEYLVNRLSAGAFTRKEQK
jgi:hypothetical protein